MPADQSIPGPAPTQPPGLTMPEPTEIITVHSRVAACDGGDGALGHPRVFLRIVHQQVQCPYCSRLYVLEGDGHEGH